MYDKEMIIDGKNHLLGKLASIVAKEALAGQRIVIVRAELLNISGLQFRKQTEWTHFLTLQSNSNPRIGGCFHNKAPSRIFWRALRGMLPHKSARGAKALERVKIFEGMPHPYSHLKKNVVPSAMRVNILKKGRKFTVLGEFCKKIGYNKFDLLNSLEKKREEKAKVYYENKMEVIKKVNAEVNKNSEITELKNQLVKFGY